MLLQMALWQMHAYDNHMAKPPGASVQAKQLSHHAHDWHALLVP